MRTGVAFVVASLVASTVNAEVLECTNGTKTAFTNEAQCPQGYQPKRLLKLNEKYPTPAPQPYSRPAPTYSPPQVIVQQPRVAQVELSCEQLRALRDYYRRQMEPGSGSTIKDLFGKLRDTQEKMNTQGCRI
ncbi:hypothetical protein [Chromobacterium subtsugae]|uniref:hypothetical protein n=1 Tax=Chromobacterium subtsugae TaxID=251747 RepID=UPI000AC7E8C7|nr:hypothetical protein [Chromobacterium subtsugae]